MLERGGMLHQRLAIARLIFIDGDVRHLLQIRHANRNVGRHEPPARCDDQGARPAARRCTKRVRVCELAAEIEAAHECEDFADGSAAVREPRGQRTGAALQQHPRASA